MNKRFFVALILTAIVIVVTPLLFPDSMRSRTTAADSAKAAASVPANASQAKRTSPGDTNNPAKPGSATPAAISAVSVADSSKTALIPSAPQSLSIDSTSIVTRHGSYAFSSRGAVPTSVLLDSGYRSLSPGNKGKPARLVDTRGTLAKYWLVSGRDTISLDTIPLQREQGASGSQAVAYVGTIKGNPFRLEYSFSPDSANDYLMHVSASSPNALPGGALLVQLPRTLRSNEADTLDDLHHLAVSYRSSRGDVQSVGFAKLDSTETRLDAGPINWVAIRNKYFLTVFRAQKTPFSAIQIQGAPKNGKVAEYATTTVVLPMGADGKASFDIYAGPQNFERLQRMGGDLDQVNPYAGWLHGVVQPFATIVMKALLWMKRTTHLNYGWVLVLFGVVIRLVLWPLNQGAMRTSMKMQRLQPDLQAIQKKYSDDPKRQQEAIMKVYKDHGMSPLSPLMGCLPMLLPMPILFALYYVFQNTIEFRGVPFLWLPDISLRDPFYITPLLMGISMFVMSWIGMRNAPPNPQAKMMSYMMPVMFTVLFLNFASGLNLYYAVQNIAALPQQWLLARERGKPVVQVSREGLEKRRT